MSGCGGVDRTDLDRTALDLSDLDLTDLDLTDLDPSRPGSRTRPSPGLRREAPVWWHEPTDHTPDGMGFWVVSRHAEMQAIASDAETFSSARAPDAPGGGTLIEDLPYGFAAGVLLNMMDDPRHHRIRRLVTPAVAPRALALLEGELRARTATILDAVAARGRCDFLSMWRWSFPSRPSPCSWASPTRTATTSWRGPTPR